MPPPSIPSVRGRTARPGPPCRRVAPVALGALLVAALAASCAGFDRDVHLSPAWSDLSMAGGGREQEALAGAVRVRYTTPDGPMSHWAVRPFVSRTQEPDGDSLTRFIVPLGTRKVVGENRLTQLLPVARYERDRDELGRLEWRYFMLIPPVVWSQDPSGRTVRAIFPIGGVVERFVTYDRIVFAAFPLYMKTEREGRTSYHVLWPFFAWSFKPGGPTGFRFWPFYGVNKTEFRERRFFLWPFFHVHHDRLHLSPDKQEHLWMFFPFVGRERVGSLRSTTVLWPFFGYASDPASGFWAWDGPWPFVRYQRPGTSDAATRSRVWPFFGHYEGDGLESSSVLWPILTWRTETYPDGRREAENYVPFWQNWRRYDLSDRREGSWEKLWPVYQRYVDEKADRAQLERFAFPALNPLWHTPVIDDHYAWVYELYVKERIDERIRERSWGGLWRRDRDAYEDRTYLTGLWSRRIYVAAGERVKETSLLFGLLRWRAGPGGGLMLPALPGPGWPIERSRERLAEAR